MWLHNSPSVLWRVGNAGIPAFNDALMAARATKIVMDHFQIRQLAPDPFPLETLSGRVRRPSLGEFKSVQRLEHLAKCIEEVYRYSAKWGPFRSTTGTEKPPSPSPHAQLSWFCWRTRLHRSVYRVLLLGAALCRVYQQPLLNEEDPLSFLDETSGLMGDLGHLGTKSPVFRDEASNEDLEPMYGAIAELLVQEAQYHETFPDAQRVLPVSAHPSTGLDLTQANALFVEMTECLWVVLQLEEYDQVMQPRYKPSPHTQSIEVTVILFGTFEPQKAVLPLDPRTLRGEFLYFESIDLPPAQPRAATTITHPLLYYEGLRYLCQSWWEEAHPCGFSFFQFVCRVYLGLQLTFVLTGFPPNNTRLFTEGGDVYLEHPDYWPEGVYSIFEAAE